MTSNVIIVLCIIALLILVVVVVFGYYAMSRNNDSLKGSTGVDGESLVNVEEQAPLSAPVNRLMIADVSEIILSDGSGNELSFSRPDTGALAKRKYQEICVGGSSIGSHLMQGAMPALAQAQTLHEIAKAAPNGLFTATAPVGQLMKLSDGVVGSAVMKDGTIVAQAGFKEVVAQAVNPAVVIGAGMQAMAMVSGQYYMHQITKQLSWMNIKLDRLMQYHHDEKVGTLASINNSLGELTNKSCVDASDIIEIRQLRDKANEILFEYQRRLVREKDDISDVKSRWYRKSKEVQEMKDNLDEREIDFSIQVCCYASELVEKCRLAEIAIRMKIGGQERSIEEQFERLRSEHKDAFYRNADSWIESIYSPVINKEIDALKLPFNLELRQELEKASKGQADIEQHMKALQESADSSDQKILVEQMLKSLDLPQEILYLPGDSPGQQRVFMAVDAEGSSQISDRSLTAH